MNTWGDFEKWSQGELAVTPGETDQNYLFKAVLTGNASLVVKALLTGADPNAPCSTQARADLCKIQEFGMIVKETWILFSLRVELWTLSK